MLKVSRKVILTMSLVLLTSSCASVSYYSQAVAGQWRILVDREPIEQVLADPGQPIALQAQLRVVQRVLNFASQTVGMDPQGRYESYVDVGRPSVVWNVFAAAPDAIVGEQWCYPIVGCAPYRGYFTQRAAQALADRLKSRGLQTYVAGVTAYSTLGWFEDPVLSTFIDWPEPDLAALLLHELAHGVVWVEDDVTFNESFATAVAEIALLEYYQGLGQEGAYKTWLDRRAGWSRMKARLLTLRSALGGAFARGESGDLLYAQFQAQYQNDRDILGNGRFDKLVFADLNNAYLVSLGAYEGLVPAFRCLHQGSATWAEFFAEVRRAAELNPAERKALFRHCFNRG